MKTYIHKNVSTQTVAIFPAPGKRIEMKPGQEVELDVNREGQGIIVVEKIIDKEVEEIKEKKTKKTKKNKESDSLDE